MFWNRNLLPYNVYSVLIDLEFRDCFYPLFRVVWVFSFMLCCYALFNQFFRHELREVFKTNPSGMFRLTVFIQSKIALLDWYHCKLVLLIYWALIWCLYNHFSSLSLSFSTLPIIVVKFINFCIDVMKSRLHNLWTVVRS